MTTASMVMWWLAGIALGLGTFLVLFVAGCRIVEMWEERKRQ